MKHCIVVILSVILIGSSAAAQQTSSPPAEKVATEAQASASSNSTAKESQSQPVGETGTAAAAQAPAIDPKTGRPLYESIKEDWKSLSVKGSDLNPEPPLVGEVDEEPGFTRTLVSLKWRIGDPIDVYVIVPKGVTKPPVVLYLYTYTEDTDRFKNDTWCEHVTRGGVAAVGFVSALSGHRFHDRPMKQWFVSEFQESLGSTVHDVKFILDYLKTRGDVDMSRVGMFGQGSGGAITVLAAAADPRIKAIDLLQPWGDWPVWLAKSSVVQDDPDKERYTQKAFLEKVKPLDPVKWLPKLKSIPIRIQQVLEYDDSVPDECQDRIKAAAPKQAQVDRFEGTAQLATIEGGGRMFDWIRAEVSGMRAADTSNKNSAAKKSTGSGSAVAKN